MKRALITGITGQDGSYLADYLLDKGYHVSGLARQSSWRSDHCGKHLDGKIEVLFGDITNNADIENAILKASPDEIYNLAAQSSPADSWMQPAESILANGTPPVRLYESLRKSHQACRLYQASSSEMFGQSASETQDELTPLNPVNPYGASKAYAHHMAKIYREAYGLHISTGILFNHESERRPLHYLCQKVTYAAACAGLGIRTSPDLNELGRPVVTDNKLALGNLDIARDWGYAPDYVHAMWLILQHPRPDDFVIGTGKLHKLSELCAAAYHCVGHDWRRFVVSDPQLQRPLETKSTLADSSKAKNILGWSPTISFEEMIERMVKAHLERLIRRGIV